MALSPDSGPYDCLAIVILKSLRNVFLIVVKFKKKLRKSVSDLYVCVRRSMQILKRRVVLHIDDFTEIHDLGTEPKMA